MSQGVLRFQYKGVCNSAQDFRSATVSPFHARPLGGANRAVTQGFSPCLVHGLFSGDGQLIRSYHSAHGRVDGLPQVRGVYHQLEEE